MKLATCHRLTSSSNWIGISRTRAVGDKGLQSEIDNRGLNGLQSEIESRGLNTLLLTGGGDIGISTIGLGDRCINSCAPGGRRKLFRICHKEGCGGLLAIITVFFYQY
jgi:hypothetical protein